MSEIQTIPETIASNPDSSCLNSISKAQSAIQSLSPILGPLPPSLSSSDNPPFSLLHDPHLASAISSHLRQPNSGAGDNNLCRWLYDTFQSSDPNLQLVVLRFLPIIAGIYLSRAAFRKPLAGFEAVLLALYAHETTSRGGQSITVHIPDLSHSSLYHESKVPIKNNATGLNLAVISPSLEPLGTVRSTKRARIVGVALELYYSKISLMPIGSKIDFCEFCVIWAGQDGEMFNWGEAHEKEDSSKLSEQGNGDGEESVCSSEVVMGNRSVGEECEEKGGRIPLPWELLQPVLRVLGHCLMGPTESKELNGAAWAACRSLYARALHDVNPQAILATGSLLKLGKMAAESNGDSDPSEILDSKSLVITL
ncbi:hypothetical protein HHK36_017014 [Tetracentron sinense]|uniref:Hyccin n=1 Tax=Tetracentron sinense TaxID=13715 RepID=A0A835DBH2_TETSI|nr:hypothetical protein HHK36_017014 [Tetracentron sinense]